MAKKLKFVGIYLGVLVLVESVSKWRARFKQRWTEWTNRNVRTCFSVKVCFMFLCKSPKVNIKAELCNFLNLTDPFLSFWSESTAVCGQIG